MEVQDLVRYPRKHSEFLQQRFRKEEKTLFQSKYSEDFFVGERGDICIKGGKGKEMTKGKDE